MAHDDPPFADLRSLYASLRAKLAAASGRCRERVQTLENAIREAETWAFRRAAKHDRDRRCYRLGAAFEPEGGLALDDVFVAGLGLLGGHAVALLAAAALEAPAGASLSELMHRVSRTQAGRTVRAWGVWSRFTWLRELYRQAVVDFEESQAGRDPRASWRKKPVTSGQAYLAVELARFLQLDPPSFAYSGEAHDWLLASGGNPRFQIRPELPWLPSAAELRA